MEKINFDFEYFVGRHKFSGYFRGLCDNSDNQQLCTLFIVDDKTYKIQESLHDYYIQEIVKQDFKTFEPVDVDIFFKKDNKSEFLVFVDSFTNKDVLILGIDYLDIENPQFISHFHMSNLCLNDPKYKLTPKKQEIIII